ncbi:gluconeogenesis factor YvcK family protein [Succinispira mobilis]|uniref:gluconeogenesis factor YvcK family protein n=1 Tax=Succinispira mobilis TaxID=78120 RepID=UPI00035E1BED|nr:YvcK family protein [Succinispira mobilis]
MRWIKWLYPGMDIKRWLFLFTTGVIIAALGIALLFKYKFIHVVEKILSELTYFSSATNYNVISLSVGILLLIIGIFLMVLATRKSIHSILEAIAPENNNHLLEKIFSKKRLARGPVITVIGGGTGLSVLLRGIKQITNNCTAVVTSADDGGSSGRLRQEFGIIPPGDCRNCLIALADTEPLMEKLMQYRFKGENQLAGHNFGNLFITAMHDIVGDMEGALSATSEILKVRGRVIPSSVQPVELVAEMHDGKRVRGESSISQAAGKIARLEILPETPQATSSALKAIEEADVIILGPGSLYTSVISNLLIPEIKQALLKSAAVKIYICNVMTQPGETDGFSAFAHVQKLLEYIDGVKFLDYVILNNQLDINPELLEKYATQGAYPVLNDSDKIIELGIKVVPANLISQDNLIRHNSNRLARTLIRLIYNLHLSNSIFNIFEYYFIKNIIKNLGSKNKEQT